MIVLLDKRAGSATIYHSRTDLMKFIKVSETTFYNWAKIGYKETEDYNIYFNVEDHTSKSKRRKNNFK